VDSLVCNENLINLELYNWHTDWNEWTPAYNIVYSAFGG